MITLDNKTFWLSETGKWYMCINGMLEPIEITMVSAEGIEIEPDIQELMQQIQLRK